MKKKIDKNYLIQCKRLFFILPKIRKFARDNVIAQCISYTCDVNYPNFKEVYRLIFNDKQIKMFDDLSSIVRNLMPYLDDSSIQSLIGMGVQNESI